MHTTIAAPVRDRRDTGTWPVLAVLLTGPFLAQADATIVNVATPLIPADLGASGAQLELVVGGYLIAFAALLITGARLGHRYGYRRLFLLGLASFAAASLLCGVAPTPGWLVGARVAQGLGAALLFPQTLTGIQRMFHGTARSRAIGWYALALSGGAVTGQLLGGVLSWADLAGTQWRAVFFVNVPVATVALIAGLLVLPVEPPDGRGRLDLPGVAVLAAALILLIVPLVLGRGAGWPAWAWWCLVAAVPAWTAFVVLQRRVTARGGAPLVNLAVLLRPAAGWALVTLTLATGTYYALLFVVAQYLQRGLSWGALASGLALVPWVAAFGAAGQVVRRMPAALRSRMPFAGTLLLAAAYTALGAMLGTGARSGPVLLVVLATGGFGLGVQFSALIAHLTGVVPVEYAPDVSGVSTTLMQIGGAIGVATLGSLYLGAGTPAGPVTAAHAFRVEAWAAACVALVASACAYRATRRTGTHVPDAP